MCITFEAAELSDTKLYAGEATLGDKYVHVVAYQNKAATTGPNAMILPIPAARLPDSSNVIDTRDFRHFLDDVQDAVRIKDKSARAFTYELETFEAKVFDVGSYTVVLAQKPQAVERALGRVPDHKRPSINPAVVLAFDELYPDWPLAVCCWNGAIEAEPLLWWYEPMTPDWLFAPALDAHDGRAPDTTAIVPVNHRVAFGSTLRPTGATVRYRDVLPMAAQTLLAPMVRGTRVVGKRPNGDFWLSTTALDGPALRRAPGAAARAARVPLDGWME